MLFTHPSAPASAAGDDSKEGRIALQSLTLPENRFISLTRDGEPAVVWGNLLFPATGPARAPAVVLAHGCAGLTSTVTEWAKQLAMMGVASFALDSFGGREIRETCTGQSRINRGSRIIDAYRALESLSTHARIDPSRIALMGFSQGGGVTLLARQLRLQRLWMRAEREFSAYLAFYPATCNYRFHNETEVSDRPLGIFQGTADDWTPIGACREYVQRMRAAGKDVRIFEYAGAHHGFDNPRLPAARFRPEVQNSSGCLYVEREPSRFRVLHGDTGKPTDSMDSCRKRGATIGHHPAAYRQAIQDVREFLRTVFKI